MLYLSKAIRTRWFELTNPKAMFVAAQSWHIAGPKNHWPVITWIVLRGMEIIPMSKSGMASEIKRRFDVFLKGLWTNQEAIIMPFPIIVTDIKQITKIRNKLFPAVQIWWWWGSFGIKADSLDWFKIGKISILKNVWKLSQD